MKVDLSNDLVQKMPLTRGPKLGEDYVDWLPTDKPNYLVYDNSRKAPPGFAVRVGARASVYLVGKMFKGKNSRSTFAWPGASAGRKSTCRSTGRENSTARR